MMRKLFLILLAIFVTNIYAFAYEPYLPKGSLIKVYTRKPLNTQSLEEGSKVYFMAPFDVWVQEQKAVESGDIFLGYVSMLKMPIQGVNASMSIDITDIVKKNGQKSAFKGKIIFSNSPVLGGTLTNPASYNTTIHPRKVYGNHWGGTLQYVPSGEYEFGRHVEVNSRDNIFVQLEEDYYI